MMDKIISFDKPTVRQLRDAMNEELQTLGKKYGVTFRLGSATFYEKSVNFKLEAVVEGEDNTRVTKAKNALEIYAKAYLPGVDLEKTYNHPNPEIKTFTIVGWNTKAREYPVIIQAADGKRYKNSIEAIQRLIRKSA
jgi:hypothetical protein